MALHEEIDHTGLPGVGGGGGIDSGTAFPGGPSTGDLFFRTDRGLLYYYDGTRWVTTNLYTLPMHPDRLDAAISTTGTMYRGACPKDHDIYVTTIDVVTWVATPNDGSNHWTITANKIGTAGVTALGSFNTSSDTEQVYTQHQIAVNAVVDTSDYATLQIGLSTKTNSPGVMAPIVATFHYRLIG